MSASVDCPFICQSDWLLLLTCRSSRFGSNVIDPSVILIVSTHWAHRKPCTNLKLLYISIRVVSLGSQLFVRLLSQFAIGTDFFVCRISTGLTLRLTGTGPASLRSCRVIAGLQGASSQVLMMAVQTILILRGVYISFPAPYLSLKQPLVQALFHEKIYLMRFLRGLFFLEIVLMTILFILGLPQLQFGLHCVITFFPGIVVGYLYAPLTSDSVAISQSSHFSVSPMLFEFLLFVLTMIKFYHAIRDGWGQENVVTRFLKDGIWAFALPFGKK